MDSLSITTDCITLGNSISKASLVLNGFVREVPQARPEAGGILRELRSLQGVLDLVKEDAGFFPPDLSAPTPGVVEHCQAAVDELDQVLALLNNQRISAHDRKRYWTSHGRQESARFVATLGAHRAILGCAVDLVEASVTRDANADAASARKAMINQQDTSDEAKAEVERILGELASLRIRLSKELASNDPEFVLRHYLNQLRRHAEAILGEPDVGYLNEPGAFLGDRQMFGVYVGDDPDSAVELYEAPAFRALKDTLLRSLDLDSPPPAASLFEAMQAEEDWIIPSHTPTPPPRSHRRLEAQLPKPDSPPGSPPSLYNTVTEASSGSDDVFPAAVAPATNTTTTTTAPTTTTASSKFKKLLGHMRGTSEDRPPTVASGAPSHGSAGSKSSGKSSSSSRSGEAPRPPSPVVRASLTRKEGQRLSVNFKRLPLWANDLGMLTDANESAAVFGVSVQKSIKVAKGTARARHTNGGGSGSGGGGSSHRDFPLCMHRCQAFLKSEGLDAPDIFAEPGDPARVQRLKEVFSHGPDYGADLTWEGYGVYDAADLMLLYLSQLPKPLVSEGTAKRWVALSRQARTSDSRGTRTDQCIDFWDEALSPLRGPGRSLFKLLLNLWADIAGAEDLNDMTPERLSRVVLESLMHYTSTKHETDFMLALAFLIRQRMEYNRLLRTEPNRIRSPRVAPAHW